MHDNQKGNVLVYILIAVALMAALTYTVSRDGVGGQETTQLNAAQIKLMASDLITHAAAARMAVDQMAQWGINYDEILFDLPTDAGYTSNITKQIYHPSGGGLPVFDITKGHFKETFPNAKTFFTYGWGGKSRTNVEWTVTSATDVIYTAGYVDPDVCVAINEQLIGSSNIPNVANNFNIGNHFSNKNLDVDFLNSECPSCVNRQSMCIYKNSLRSYLFYNIIGAR